MVLFMMELLKTRLHYNLHPISQLTVDFIPKAQRLFVGRSWLSTFFFSWNSPPCHFKSSPDLQNQMQQSTSPAVIQFNRSFWSEDFQQFLNQSFCRPWHRWKSMSGAVRRVLGRKWYYYRLLGRSRHRQHVQSRSRCCTAIKGDFIFFYLFRLKTVLCWGYRVCQSTLMRLRRFSLSDHIDLISIA